MDGPAVQMVTNMGNMQAKRSPLAGVHKTLYRLLTAVAMFTQQSIDKYINTQIQSAFCLRTYSCIFGICIGFRAFVEADRSTDFLPYGLLVWFTTWTQLFLCPWCWWCTSDPRLQILLKWSRLLKYLSSRWFCVWKVDMNVALQEIIAISSTFPSLSVTCTHTPSLIMK